jgi:hypothetical protein
MLKDLFTKIAPFEPEVALPEFVTCRSWYGLAIHVRRPEREDGKALCGYAPANDGITTTKEDIIAGIPNQHSGYFYCSNCASILTGIPTEEIIAQRSNGN